MIISSRRAGGPNGRPYILSPEFTMPHHHPCPANRMDITHCLRPLATNPSRQKNR